MKRALSVLVSVGLLSPILAQADRAISLFTNLDTFVKECKVSFIGECLPIVETNVSAFVYVRTMRVITPLQGPYAAGKEVIVLAATPLVPGHYYLICGDENLKHEVGTWWLEEGEVEIHVEGGDVRNVRERHLGEVIKALDDMPLKDKLRFLFKRRQEQLKAEEEKTKRELEILDRALKPSGESSAEH